MSLAILKSNTQIAQRVFFLHEELMKLPSFPRKALEADFNLYCGPLGKVNKHFHISIKLILIYCIKFFSCYNPQYVV